MISAATSTTRRRSAAGLTTQTLKRLPLTQALPGHQRPLGLLNHHPSVQSPLQLGGQLTPLLTLSERLTLSYGVVDQQVARPPGGPVRVLAEQHHPQAVLVGLQLIQRGLGLPPRPIQRRQLGRGCPLGRRPW